ncbi:AAA family ATPase [Cystobacter fuscus]|uniref:AAA family ATPase n=1 Tax=Cystobacter fuscus TaxID=43 RepID=UPI002B30C01C|nr:AAA family ATPase [Cystobacter fuscus]
MYVRSLTIQNLRSFESVELPLCHPGDGAPPAPTGVPYLDNVTLLLGSNGSGKTSVLRAVALSTLAPVLAMGSGYVPYALVRRVKGRPTEARVKAHVVLHDQDGLGEGKEEEIAATLMAPPRGYTDRFLIESKPPSWHIRLWDEESPAFLVLGYGATRRVETGASSVEGRAKERILRYRRVAGLFEEHMTLMPLAAWLPQVARKDKKRHQEIVNLMNELLPEGTKMLGKWEDREDPESLFQRGGSVLPFPALSDGYRAFLCWVGDVLYHLHLICKKGQRLVDMRGVVLVDEVDLHLHPEWQRHLVPSLSRAFPRLQFVLTSHSPLVVSTLSSQNVLLLEERKRAGGVMATEVLRPGEELYGLSADQILTSQSFGLESSRDERFFEQLKEVADQARDGGSEDALRFMRMVAGGPVAGDAPVSELPGRELLVLRGHENSIAEVAWDPMGRRVASASWDETVRVWDGETGRELLVLSGHEEAVVGVAWDPMGRRVASASWDKTVRVWDGETGRELLVLSGHKNEVIGVAWDPMGRRVASASNDGTVRVWDGETGRELLVLSGHENEVIGVAWDPMGRRVASASWDKTVRVWDGETGRELLVLSGHEEAVVGVAWDPMGRRVASASWDKTVRVWDGETGRELLVLSGHEEAVVGVAWDPMGRRVASVSRDKTVRVWDGETGRELSVLRGHEEMVIGMAWDSTGLRVASASSDKMVRVWEISSKPGILKPQKQSAKKSTVRKPSSRTSTKSAKAQRKASHRPGRK